MVYNANVPNASDFLDESQPVLKSNFQQLDTSMGIDHYNFSNTSGNTGKHKFVTQPKESAAPATSAEEPKIYALDVIPSLADGVLQFSRGGTSATPTPLTAIHSSSSAPIVIIGPGTSNVLDFTGITRAMCEAYVGDFSGSIYAGSQALVLWTGSNLIVRNFANTSISFTNSGSILQIQVTGTTTFSNLYWTLQFVRFE